MKVLLTGATGFLGKQVLSELLKEERVSEIILLSRSERKFLDSRIKSVKCDLSDPTSLYGVKNKVDAIIHLAGLYQFEANYRECYLHNILATSSIVQWAQRTQNQPLFLHASSYAVENDSWGAVSNELPLTALPSKKKAYAHTKAMAEKLVLESSVRGVALRLGILVGDSQSGEIAKLDGPYYLLNFLQNLKSNRVLGRLPVLPIPGARKALLPLVPVDVAALAFVKALFMNDLKPIYGVYNPNSLRASILANLMVRRYFPRTKVLMTRAPSMTLKLQTRYTHIPSQLFDFCFTPTELKNPEFTRDFSENLVPSFQKYQDVFFRGYSDFLQRENA